MMKWITFLLLIFLLTNCQKALFEDKNNDPVFIFQAYWNEVDRNYAFFQYNHLNWDSVYNSYKLQIGLQTSNDSLFKIIGTLTDLLHDAHTNIYSPMGVAGNIYYFDNYPTNQITLNTDVYFDYYLTGKIFDYGKLKKKNAGYIRIKTFEGDYKNFDAVDSLFTALNTTDGLIIDVRSNFGGDISNSKIIASRFIDSPRYICRCRARNGSGHADFSSWTDVYLYPSLTGVRPRKPIIILTNRTTYSATEWFVLFAHGLSNVTTVGDTTGGGSAIPIIRELPNGWVLRISNTQLMMPSGRDFQNSGLFPDVPVWISKNDRENGTDTILEKAMALLSEK